MESEAEGGGYNDPEGLTCVAGEMVPSLVQERLRALAGRALLWLSLVLQGKIFHQIQLGTVRHKYFINFMRLNCLMEENLPPNG